MILWLLLFCAVPRPAMDDRSREFAALVCPKYEPPQKVEPNYLPKRNEDDNDEWRSGNAASWRI